MSLIVFGHGRVARGNLGPQEDFVTRNRAGEAQQELFRRCHVFCTDRLAPPRKLDDGSTRPATQLVQLIFDSGVRHEKIFSWLRPGRLINFRGRLDHRPRAYMDKEDLDAQGKPKLKVHANPTIYVERIDFLDSPVEHTAERFLQALVDAKKIPAEQKADMVAFLKEHLQADDGPVAEPGADAEHVDAPAQDAKVVKDGDPFEG